MVSIYSALGIFANNNPRPTKPSPSRNVDRVELVPFSARMVVERLACQACLRDFEFVDSWRRGPMIRSEDIFIELADGNPSAHGILILLK